MPNFNGHPRNVTWQIRRVITRGNRAGLVVTSTTGGVHAAFSYHRPIFGARRNRGRAVDMAGSRAAMVSFQKAEVRRFRRFRRHKEIIGPDNAAIVLRQQETNLVEGTGLETQHDNHVHIAI
jgi:hypothetical protein